LHGAALCRRWFLPLLRDWLPVIDASRRLDGVVDQSRLTASLVLDVANQLSAGAAPQHG
jgi:hypothetical protein